MFVMSKSIRIEFISVLLLFAFTANLLAQQVQTTTLVANADAMVKEDYPTQNFGSLTYFAAAVQPKSLTIYRGLLRFAITEEYRYATFVTAPLYV